jgi:hypothetical protein
LDGWNSGTYGVCELNGEIDSVGDLNSGTILLEGETKELLDG